MQTLKVYLANLLMDPRTRHPGKIEIYLRGSDGFYIPVDHIHYRNQQELRTMVRALEKSLIAPYLKRIVLSSNQECRHRINLFGGRIRLLPVYTFKVSLSRHKHPTRPKPVKF